MKFQQEVHQTDENIEFEGKINEQSLALDILSTFDENLKLKINKNSIRIWVCQIVH